MRFILAFTACLISFSAFANSDYVVLYKNSLILDRAALSLREKKEAMKEETRKLEEAVLSKDILSETLWIVGGSIIIANDRQVEKLNANPRVKQIVPLGRRAWLTDTLRPLSSDYSYGVEKLGLPEIQQRFPTLDGRGIRVGIIDTGIDGSSTEFKGKILGFRDFIANETEPYDDYGHGSFVAGVIAGGDASGTQIGLAPAAQLFVAKTFSEYGGSEDANLLRALQWMADPDGNSNTDDGPKIISNSWNVDSKIPSMDPTDEPFCVALDRLKELGITSVFSAGNDGPAASTIIVPGACPSAITVGASDRDDALADMSSRGPIRWKTQTTPKPDIVAPGIDIYSAWKDGDYIYKSGTSMATPFAAGALALIVQKRGPTAPETLRQILRDTARKVGPSGSESGYGAGVISAINAVQ